MLQVTKGKTELSFYSLPEFEEWKRETENWHTYRVKYYKGLYQFSPKLHVILISMCVMNKNKNIIKSVKVRI